MKLSGTLFAGATAAEAPISAGALYVALFYGGAALVLAILGIWTKLLTSKVKRLRPSPENAKS